MSIKLMTIVWDLEMDPGDKLVLLALADNASDEGHCFPSIATITRRCQFNERTIQRALSRLEAGGHLSRRMRPGRSTLYSIHPRAAEPPAQSHPRQYATPGTESPHPRPNATTTPGNTPPTPGNTPPISVKESSSESQRESATRLPSGFLLTAERREVARQAGIDANHIDLVFIKFTNHWKSSSSKSAVKCDWDAAWSTWCIDERDGKSLLSWKPSEDGESVPAPKGVNREVLREAFGKWVVERYGLKGVQATRFGWTWLHGPQPGFEIRGVQIPADGESKELCVMVSEMGAQAA
jgi:hypothetical protein